MMWTLQKNTNAGRALLYGSPPNKLSGLSLVSTPEQLRGLRLVVLVVRTSPRTYTIDPEKPEAIPPYYPLPNLVFQPQEYKLLILARKLA